MTLQFLWLKRQNGPKKNTYSTDEWNVMSKLDIGVANSCLEQGCGFTAYTSLPPKYEKHYHINDSLGLEMALSQNPKILYSLVTMEGKCPHIHFRSSDFFRCHFHSCSDDARRLVFDPNELWNMIVWTASGETQAVHRGRRPSRRQQWSLFIKVPVSWPELEQQCLLLPSNSNKWSNNPGINSYENMSTAVATVVKMTSRACETLNVGFRSENTESDFHMSLSLMCSDGLFEQHFFLSSVAAVQCQIITGAKFSVYVLWI